MIDMEVRAYQAQPCYPQVGAAPMVGWPAIFARMLDQARAGAVVAVDGPQILPWIDILAALESSTEGSAVRAVDVRDQMAPWPTVCALTSSPELADDPHFEILATGSLSGLFPTAPVVPRNSDGVTVIFGPGAALADHDLLCYVDLPKRFAEAVVTSGEGTNLGQRPEDGAATTKRLFYVDWPLLDRHRDDIADDIALWVDAGRPEEPVALEGSALRASLETLAGQPFRTRPTFNTTPWGGHWAQRQLQMNQDEANTALGYELIAPESGILIGPAADRAAEVPFALLVARHAERIMGSDVHQVFGTSFPIRFDYLDTVGGGDLSVHCHPQRDYMRDVFGWPYTQHESYYLMVAGEKSEVFLGLRQDVDIELFRKAAELANEDGRPFEIRDYVQTLPAQTHQLYLIPAGTPHGSGHGNVVLEVSATPYLYSLRFYDWLRHDQNGRQRAVHVGHAFDNLNPDRTGQRVLDELVQPARPVRSGTGWTENVIGTLADMFFEVRRFELDPGADAQCDTDGRFHILNVVEGGGVAVLSSAGTHQLSYAETLVVPAAVGPYRLVPIGTAPVRIVKSLVR